MTCPLDLDSCPPCGGCGGILTVRGWPDEGPLWSAECRYCSWEWIDLPERPTWRMLAAADPLVAALVAALVAGGLAK